jgi:hypothetical protein
MMSTMTTTARPAGTARTASALDLAEDLGAPTSLGDISCWRLLTARVPLTLLVDLALPAEDLEASHEEMLTEPTSLDWIPAQRR